MKPKKDFRRKVWFVLLFFSLGVSQESCKDVWKMALLGIGTHDILKKEKSVFAILWDL
jgi:hypothetical protein